MAQNGNITHLPLVSVVMATYNEPPTFIEESIKSILNQTYSHLELIIADDSTHADTISAIDRLAEKDDRIHLIRKSERMGFVPALNEAIKASKGDFIARMDGDDVSLPDRIELQLKYAEQHPDVDVFGGSMYIINKDGETVSERNYPTTPSSIKRMFVFRSPFAHPTVMFRRKIVDKGNLYNPEYKKAEDIDFFMRLYKQGYGFGNLSDKLLRYRVVGDLQNKRSREQWIFNHKARSRFIARKPLFSICSFCISFMYMYVPECLVSFYYKRENTKGNH